MAEIHIVGDGPGGLSAALFLAKNGQQVTVFGLDQTAMNHAYLYNYLGFDAISGTDLQQRGRQQVVAMGAQIRDVEVTGVIRVGPGLLVETATGEGLPCDYLILSEGRTPTLAASLGLEGPDGIEVDRNGRTAVARVYVVGRSARPTRSQAIISAGDGAAAALDILSIEAGKDIQDWDTPPKEGTE